MEQYISKSALVAEIERRIIEGEKAANILPSSAIFGLIQAYKNTLSLINTLEVKEVDFGIEQRMKECPYRQVVCIMYEGKILECKGACYWVVDYPKLKELKAQKVE